MTRLSKSKSAAPKKRKRAAAALIKAMQASPYRDVNIESKREPMPVRDFSL